MFPELIPQGPGKRRSAAFTDRFAYYRKATKVYQPRVDFHSFRGNVETDLKNRPSTNQAWIDELIGHESTIRRSEGERYTKQINLPLLQNLVNQSASMRTCLTFAMLGWPVLRHRTAIMSSLVSSRLLKEK